MGLAKNFVGSGFSGMQAQALTTSVMGTAVVAAGTTQGTATALTADLNFVTSGGASAGVILYDGQTGDSQEIFNNQLVSIYVYPPTGDKINQLATNAGFYLNPNTYAYCKKLSATQWVAMVSA